MTDTKTPMTFEEWWSAESYKLAEVPAGISRSRLLFEAGRAAGIEEAIEALEELNADCADGKTAITNTIHVAKLKIRALLPDREGK